MRVKKRNGSLIEFDSKKIVDAILKALQESNCNKDELENVINNYLENCNIKSKSVLKKCLEGRIIQFVRYGFFKNYNLMINKLYYLKLWASNKENWYTILKFISKQVGQIGTREIIRMIIVKLIENIKDRRESYKLPFIVPNYRYNVKLSE